MYSESIRRPCKEVEVVGHNKKAPHQIIRARLACLAFNRRGVILKEVGDLNYYKLCKGAFKWGCVTGHPKFTTIYLITFVEEVSYKTIDYGEDAKLGELKICVWCGGSRLLIFVCLFASGVGLAVSSIGSYLELFCLFVFWFINPLRLVVWSARSGWNNHLRGGDGQPHHLWHTHPGITVSAKKIIYGQPFLLALTNNAFNLNSTLHKWFDDGQHFNDDNNGNLSALRE